MGVDGCSLRVMNMNAGWTNGKSGVSYALVLGSIPSPATIFAVAPVPRDDRPIKWGDGVGEMPDGIKAPKIKGFVI